MAWTIKMKLFVLGIGVVVALSIMAGLNYFSGMEVDTATEKNSERIEYYRLSRDMKYAALELTTAAMDSIIDKDEGKIESGRMTIIRNNIAFLTKNLNILRDVVETEEEKQTTDELVTLVQQLATKIQVNLVDLIEQSASKALVVEENFGKMDDKIDDMGRGIKEQLATVMADLKNKQANTYDPDANLSLERALNLVRVAELAQTRVVLAAMDSLIDRDEGVISDERLGIISAESDLFLKTIDSLSSSITSDEEIVLLKKVHTQFLELQKVVTTQLSKLLHDWVSLVKETDEDFDKIDDDLDKISEGVEKRLNIIATSIGNNLESTNKVLKNDVGLSVLSGIVAYSVIVFIVILIFFFIARDIVRGLSSVVDYANRVANGELDSKIKLKRSDEIGVLIVALQTMVENLKQLIAQADVKSKEAEEQTHLAKEAAERAEIAGREAIDARRQGQLDAANELEGIVDALSNASSALGERITDAVSGTTIQNDRSSETATAMEEMNATVLEVAKSAGHAADSADLARASASEGEIVVSEVIQSISAVKQRSDDMRERLGALGQKAESIGSIMNVISDIADQTNLLALNAAIEAARAGDAGRGFAVVADEVRKLAEKTMGATKEVTDAVLAIQGDARSAVANMQEAGSAIDACTDLASSAGMSLHSIVENISITNDQVRNIATASEEQSATSEQINRSVEDVSRIAEETADGMHQATMALDELTGLAGQLKLLIDNLREENGQQALPMA